MHHPTLQPLTLALTALALVACSDSDVEPTITLDQKPAGVYTVSVGTPDAPAVGQYLAAANGERLLVVNGADGVATKLYRQAVGQTWTALPKATADETVTLLTSQTVPSPAVVPVSAWAGSYDTRTASGLPASFQVSADGSITAASTSACKLTGKLSEGTLPASTRFTLSTTGCGGLPASVSGVLLADRDYAPVSFRLVGDADNKVVELWAFKT